jgi:ribosomal protein S14
LITTLEGLSIGITSLERLLGLRHLILHHPLNLQLLVFLQDGNKLQTPKGEYITWTTSTKPRHGKILVKNLPLHRLYNNNLKSDQLQVTIPFQFKCSSSDFAPYPTSNPMMVSQPTPTTIPPTAYNYPSNSHHLDNPKSQAMSSSLGNSSQPTVSSYGSPPVNPNYMRPSQDLPNNSLVIASSASLSTAKPTWDTTKENVNCQNCNVEFSFFKRRHHCRCCFRELCDTCTVKRSPVPHFGHREAQRYRGSVTCN